VLFDANMVFLSELLFSYLRKSVFYPHPNRLAHALRRFDLPARGRWV